VPDGNTNQNQTGPNQAHKEVSIDENGVLSFVDPSKTPEPIIPLNTLTLPPQDQFTNPISGTIAGFDPSAAAARQAPPAGHDV
jgi:hypothetical protein